MEAGDQAALFTGIPDDQVALPLKFAVDRGKTRVKICAARHRDGRAVLHLVDGKAALGKRRAGLLGKVGRRGFRRRAVVIEHQAAPGEESHHRLQRLGVGEETPALFVGDARIAGEPCHRPGEMMGVGFFALPGAQGVRAGIAVGIVVRLHRQFEQHFMAARARLVHEILDIWTARHEADRDGGRKTRKRLHRGIGARTEAQHDQDETAQ